MKLKHGVKISGVRPELLIGILAAQAVYSELGIDFVITSIMDGKHSKGSRHYIGCAFDVRTRDMSKDWASKARDSIAKAIPSDFDVVLESDHIHVEFDPRYE